MSIFMIGEVRSTEHKSGTSTAGNKWEMEIVRLLVEGARGEAVLELVLSREATAELRREPLPEKGVIAAYEVEASARTWNGNTSVQWTAVRRASELEDAIGLGSSKNASLHSVEA